jgi:hypothetical protein
MAAVAMFNSRQARMIRMAISPRLATKIFLNMFAPVNSRVERSEYRKTSA